METSLIQNKVKLLFKKITEANYVMNSYYADHFFIKINSDDPDVECLKSWPVVADLLVEALNNAENVHKTVRVFIIRLLGVVAQSEVHFAKIFAKKGEELAKAFNEINSQSMDSSLRVAYMEVALSLTKHNSGIYWLLETGIWKEILQLCNEKRTVFVVRQTYKFASLFLWKLVDINEEASIKTVLNFILKPMSEIDMININSMSSEYEDELCKVYVPMLQILLSVVGNAERIKTRNSVITSMIKDFNMLTFCYLIKTRIRREDVLLLVTKLLFWLSIGKTFIFKPLQLSERFERDDFVEVTITYFNTVNYLMQRRCWALVFDYCNACNLIFSSVWSNMRPAVFEVDGREVELQKQLLVICLIPSMVYIGAGKTMGIDGDEVDNFIIKLLHSTCEHTARTCYALRDLLLQLDMESVTLQSVKRLTCLKDHLNNDQANLLFQALFYVLKEYDPIDENGVVKADINITDSEEKVLIMTYVLDILLSLVKNYNINWKESLEVICLYSVVFNILKIKNNNFSSRFVVIALNVITITVKKFLPPTLSLLMESKPGSSMDELGELIYMKLNDFQWEVRDSALELLYVCTDICFIKFPPFQKQILSNNLINLATTMALNDHEFYVRVSALRCLGAGCKVASLWDHLKTQYPNIQELLVDIMNTNQEGVVRKEACNVLCEIYQSVKISPNFKSVLYENMMNAALSDFHWEVQLSALKFWKIVIQSLLTAQGMLDGTFPPVTFSRQTRKIVTLDANEIKRRLTATLEELSSIGCLTVLVKLLHDDTDVEIMDSARIISTELLEILDQYSVPETLTPSNKEANTMDELQQQNISDDSTGNGDTMDSEPATSSENVIESILNSDDINLLANIYKRQMNLSPEQETKNTSLTKVVRLASPYLFVRYTRSKDFKQIIEDKRNWKDGIKSLSSLLDDVLGIYEFNEEVNSLDCY
ncbi:uncharacterized protein LOC116772216 [Danaus plexippus]|uniref:uncharacterized protein LOC116772216 n=1 Tax=Danaus plexippus TaxID=13037 RepID=UPI002AB034FF|nr:uncharacterized protein LOC116772216 [Danaus plexippus]